VVLVPVPVVLIAPLVERCTTARAEQKTFLYILYIRARPKIYVGHEPP